ncbi:MAG: oligosaccharide flippase family protein [Planctomycetes bacterium]|nr:oligosaccharide flippase family protein [Planctomycetota bacterium]
MAIGFGTAPIVARLFSPEDYGVVGLISSIVQWLSAFSCFGYMAAIPLSASRAETRALLRLCLLITGALMLPVVLVPVLGGDLLIEILDEPRLKQFFWFIPVMFLLAVLRQLGSYTLSRERKFGWSALSELGNVCAARPIQIVLGGLLGGSALFLLLSTVVGGIVAVAIAAAIVVPMLVRKGDKESQPQLRLREVAKHHKQFPSVQMWTNVLNTTRGSVSVLLMGTLFATEVIGHYSLGCKLVSLPLTILGVSLGQVFYPEAADEWRRNGSIATTLHNTVRILSITCIFPLVAMGVMGPLMFELFLGANWREAGVYAQIMTPWLLVMLVASPTSTVFLIRRRAHITFIYVAVLLVAQLGAVAVGGLLGGPRLALMGFSGTGTIILLHKLGLTLKLGKVRRRTAAVLMLKEMFRALFFLAPAALAYWVANQQFVAIGLACAATAVHSLLLYKREPAVRRKLEVILARFSQAR